MLTVNNGCILLLKSFLLILDISKFSLFAVEHIRKHGNHRKSSETQFSMY